MPNGHAIRTLARAQQIGGFLAIRQLNNNIQNMILKVTELRVPPPDLFFFSTQIFVKTHTIKEESAHFYEL